MFKMIKKIVSPTSGMDEEDNILKPSYIYKEFNMIALDIFDQQVVPFMQPDRFVNGVLYINCSFEFMESINDRKQYFIDRLQEKFGEEIIYDVIFEV